MNTEEKIEAVRTWAPGFIGFNEKMIKRMTDKELLVLIELQEKITDLFNNLNYHQNLFDNIKKSIEQKLKGEPKDKKIELLKAVKKESK